MSVEISPLFARHQGRNIYHMFSQGLLSAFPLTRPRDVQTPSDWVHETLPAIPAELAARYAQWCGAPQGRYAGVIAPHMVSYWGLPLLSKLTGQAPYNLLTVLNQGCRIQTHQALPLGEPIKVAGRLASIDNDGRRIRIAMQLEAGTASVPKAQSIELMVAVPLDNPAPRTHSREERPEPVFESAGHWSAGAYDGVNFALLTGDFNPIHTLWPLARRTRHKACILHGFGFLARSYETIVNHGVAIGDFDVRFIKPLRLPASDVEVQISRDAVDDQGRRVLRLCSPDGTVHLAGHFSEDTSSSS